MRNNIFDIWRALRWSDGPVAFLSSCVPDLSFHRLSIHLNATCSELYSNSAFALKVEFISSETRQQVTLPHTRVSNQDHLKKNTSGFHIWYQTSF